MLDLSGHYALVSGGSSGIGLAIKHELSQRGATVCSTGRRVDEKQSGDQQFIRADFALEADVDRLAAEVERRFGRLDILVHNAAIFSYAPISETTLETLDELYRVNVRAVVQLTQRLLPLLKESQGQIVLINSSAGVAVPSNVVAYSAMKHALRAIADGLRKELNPAGVRVVTAFCGRVATAMQERVHQYEGKPYRPELLLQPSDIASMVVNALTLPRTAELTDFHIRPMNEG